MINVFIVNINAFGMFAGMGPLMIQPLSQSMRIVQTMQMHLIFKREEKMFPIAVIMNKTL